MIESSGKKHTSWWIKIIAFSSTNENKLPET